MQDDSYVTYDEKPTEKQQSTIRFTNPVSTK